MSRSLVVFALSLLVLGNVSLQLHVSDHHPIEIGPIGIGHGQATAQSVVGHSVPLTTLHLEAPISIRTLTCPACAIHQHLQGSHLPRFAATLQPDQTEGLFLVGSTNLLRRTHTSASPRAPPSV